MFRVRFGGKSLERSNQRHVSGLRRRVAAGVIGASAALVPAGAFAQCVDSTGGALAAFTVFGSGASTTSLISVVNTLNTVALNQTRGFISAPGGASPGQQHGGAWARALSGHVETENRAVTSDFSIFGLGIPGSIVCDTQTEQDFDGYQAGLDLGHLNLGGGANIFYGVTIGHLAARTFDRTPGESTFRASTDVPFVGVYGAFTAGKFFVDGQLRWDFFEHRVTDPRANAFGQRFEGRGFSVSGSAGYRFDLAQGYFIEPSIGGVWSRVTHDTLDLTGNAPLATGSVQLGEIESIHGRASLRIGVNFTSGAMAWQPFITASILHEFADDVQTALTPNPFAAVPFAGRTSTDRVGTYAQFGAGVSGAVIDTGWVGYARMDYRTGDQIESISANVGLRYHFDPDKMQAGLKDDRVAVAAPFKWTGVYVGGQGGSVWGDAEASFANFPGQGYETGFAGWLLGGQIGYNHQVGQIVIGVEADIARANGAGASPCPNGFVFTCQAELHTLASFSGRAGVLWGRALIYAKGGVTSGRVRLQSHFNANTQFNNGPPAGIVGPENGKTNTLVGYSAGAGVEFALTDRWSAKAEYLHYDLGSATFALSPALGPVPGDISGDLVKIGVNVKLF